MLFLGNKIESICCSVVECEPEPQASHLVATFSDRIRDLKLADLKII